ncbi:amidase [Vagococcus zengguangii]|uniref:Amidase n=1 Tax=Vagococcus zengguangii TaxID=2571750 RepID=A0A4D7CVH2_9ENTE|nr:amidase [Vagococcus zengguangii]QCI86076.1 amidase [Vagococcus zengguangii]TLG80181.1 amidase [Vagococcus zengguangii]
MKDATYWINQLKNKEISHQELIHSISNKVKKLNPELNAVITFSSSDALCEIEQREGVLQTPFAGLPVPLKILGQSKKGWLDTSGSRLFNDYRASDSNYFVGKMEQVGLLALGQTNSPEFGFKNITDPFIHGVTRNPWNVAHSPGGSSGGAAAAVASGMFPLAMASDGGGSIRIPASFCGLIGLKPTRGLMPVGPSGWRGWQGASISFGLTLSVRDTQLLFDSLRGIHTAAPYQPVNLFMDQTKRPLKIAYCLDSPVNSIVSTDAKIALQKTLKQLEKMGHQLVSVNYPVDGIRLIRSYYAMNGGETAAMFKQIEKNFNRSMTIEDMELMTWGIYQYGNKIDAADYIEALQSWDEAAFQMEELFDDYDLFLSPTTATTAPKVDAPLVSEAIQERLRLSERLNQTQAAQLIEEMFADSLALTPYTQLANLTGQPAISLPVHIGENGLPIGVQLMAKRGNDQLLLDIAAQLEQEELFELPHINR